MMETACFIDFLRRLPGMAVLVQDHYTLIMVVILNFSVMIISFSMLKKRFPYYWGMLLMVPMCSLILVVCQFIGEEQEELWIKNILFAVSMGFLFALNLGVYFLISNILREYDRRTAAEQELLKTKLYQENMEIQKKFISDMEKYRHDIKHKFASLQALLEMKDYGEALDLIHREVEVIYAIRPVVDTGNPALDNMLNHKLSYAASKKISVITRVNVRLSAGEFALNDLAVLLGNLIDNAIEAVIPMEEKREIEFLMEMKKRILYIQIKNNYQKAIIYQNGTYITTKTEGAHGYGLGSVEAIVERYHGGMRISSEDGVFAVRILLYPN